MGFNLHPSCSNFLARLVLGNSSKAGPTKHVDGVWPKYF